MRTIPLIIGSLAICIAAPMEPLARAASHDGTPTLSFADAPAPALVARQAAYSPASAPIEAPASSTTAYPVSTASSTTAYPANTAETPPSLAPPPSEASRDTEGENPLHAAEKDEHFRIGILGGVGFPRPLAVEGLIKVEQTFALGAEYSALPTLTISSVDTTFHAIAADARFFFFRGPFFIGMRAGRQHLSGSDVVTVPGYGTAQGTVTVDATFVNPRIGFLWTWNPGLTFGLDAGVQIPLTTSTSTSIPAGTVADERVRSVANSLGGSVLPTFDLLRIGFLI